MCDETLNVIDVAARFDVHPQTIYRALRLGLFPCRAVKIGGVWRINRTDVDAFLAARAAELADSGEL